MITSDEKKVLDTMFSLLVEMHTVSTNHGKRILELERISNPRHWTRHRVTMLTLSKTIEVGAIAYAVKNDAWWLLIAALVVLAFVINSIKHRSSYLTEFDKVMFSWSEKSMEDLKAARKKAGAA